MNLTVPNRLRLSARLVWIGLLGSFVLMSTSFRQGKRAQPKRGAGNEPRVVKPGYDRSLTLSAVSAELYGPSVRINATTRVAAWWTCPADQAVWDLKDIVPGRYDVMLIWGVPESVAGQRFVIEQDGKSIVSDVLPKTGGFASFEYRKFGEVTLEKDSARIAFRPADSVRGDDLADLRSIMLVPTGRGGFVAPPFQVPEGFVVEPAAEPPVVQHPMMACLDDRGRLFVSESDGVNRKSHELLAERPHRILLLEDTNQDGRYDKRTVFAEDLVLPNGAQWHDGALYVCSAPYLWRFEDTNQDGRADRRSRIAGRFNFSGMSSAFHGPVVGPDGRMYWSGGQHGWKLERPDPNAPISDERLEKSEHGYLSVAGPWTRTAPGVFSCWPDGSDAENLASGGICNPVETAFAATGEVFGTVAVYDNFQNARRDAVLHWIDGGVFNLTEKNYAGLPRTGKDLTPLSYRGHVAPAGITRYRSGNFGSDYRDNLFFTEFNTQKVYRLVVERSGASFRSRDQVFLSSDSPDVHLTDVIEDADGSLLVVDTGGWFRYGCPTSQIAKPNILGGIYRIRKADSPRLDDPRGTTLAWKSNSDQDLVELLDDPRFVVRDGAMAELARRGEPSIDALKRKRSRGSPQARRNAVWALTRIQSPAARLAVREALLDNDLSVRLAATHSAAVHNDSDSLHRLMEMVTTDDPAVRREAASALGRIGDVAAVPFLLDAAQVDNDRFLEHAVTLALIRLGDPALTLAGLEDPTPQRRRVALIALDQMADGNLTRELVAPLLDTDDDLLYAAALEVMGRHPEWIDESTGQLKTWLGDEQFSIRHRAALRGLLIASGQKLETQDLIAQSLVNDELPETTRLLLLEVMGRIQQTSLPECWLAPIQACLRDPSPPLVRESIATIATLGTRHFDTELSRIGLHEDQPLEIRLAALSVLAVNGGALSDDAIALLVAQCHADVQPVRRLDAARALGSAKLNDGQRSQVVRVVATAGPLELPSLVRAFEGSIGKPVQRDFLRALARSPGLASLPSSWLSSWLEHRTETARAEAEPLLAKLRDRRQSSGARLAELANVLIGGDEDRGREIFFARRAACAACHQVGDRGGAVGPNLSRIGEIRTRRDLLEAIVFPSASFARGYEPIKVVTDSGKIHSGIIVRETADSLYLRTVDRAEIQVARRAIEDLAPGDVSVMPQGLDEIVTRDQLRDLLAYLASLRHNGS